MSDAFLAFSVGSVLALLIAVWSLRLERRVDAAPESVTHRGVRFGALHLVMFPLSAICALAAVVVSANSILANGQPFESSVVAAPGKVVIAASDDGCESVALALSWMSSDESALRRWGALLATRVWDRAAADDDYSNALRRDCALDVLTMLDSAGLSFSGVPVDPLEA